VEATEVRYLQEYIRRAPQDYEGHLVLGHAYLRLGDLAGAAEAFRRAAELKPDMYGPPLCRKRKMRVTGWPAQIVFGLVGAQKLRALMECAARSSYLDRYWGPNENFVLVRLDQAASFSPTAATN